VESSAHQSALGRRSPRADLPAPDIWSTPILACPTRAEGGSMQSAHPRARVCPGVRMPCGAAGPLWSFACTATRSLPPLAACASHPASSCPPNSPPQSRPRRGAESIRPRAPSLPALQALVLLDRQPFFSCTLFRPLSFCARCCAPCASLSQIVSMRLTCVPHEGSDGACCARRRFPSVDLLSTWSERAGSRY